MRRRVQGSATTAAAILVLGIASGARGDEAEAFFDDTAVREIHLTFSDPNWYDTLVYAHANDPDDPYFPAAFASGSVSWPQVGVRMKGNSSFNNPSTKKPFRIDFNYYDPPGTPGELETNFLGLKKLDLNNGFKDPTMLREKLFMDFARRFVPAIRLVHCRLYINGEYYGLYVAAEHIDKTLVKDRFGDGEDGNLWEGEQAADLTWLGSSPEVYFPRYPLRTNEEENDYTALIQFIDVLNHTDANELPAEIEPLADVSGMLYNLALCNLFANLDSYIGSAHNYYLYAREDSGRMTQLLWDANEAFGRFIFGGITDMIRLPPLWTPAGSPRPLASKLWGVSAYQRLYLRALAQMLREGFSTASMQAEIDRLAGLIRGDVYADPRKFYTNAEFEANLYNDINVGGLIYGLRNFVTQRASYLNTTLNSYAARTDLRLNELMSVNTATIPDNAGEYAPWAELYNLGPGLVSLSGLYLTDDPGSPMKWALPSGSLDDGQYRILWLDGETAEGPNHASFVLQPSGGALYLYQSPGTLIDSVVYPALAENVSLARIPNGEGGWEQTNQPTPSAVNSPNQPPTTDPPVVFINEFMADNDSVIEDPDEPGEFPDWIELYNPGNQPIDLDGLYLTDDLEDPTKWSFAGGVVLPAHGFLVIWADDDGTQGPTHTNFKLSAAGEAVGLYHRDGATVIDAITFGPQATDVSYGRSEDGGGVWGVMPVPTPGGTNTPMVPGDLNCDGVVDLNDVTPFVLALVAPDEYAMAYPECDLRHGDLDNSEALDGADIALFVVLVLSP